MAQSIPFARQSTYQPSLTVADLLLRSGEQQADAERRQGEIRARLFGDLGNTIAGIPQQIQQVKTNNQRQQLVQNQIDEQASVKKGQSSLDTLMRGDQLPAGDTGPRQPSYLDSKGLWDVPKLSQALGQMGAGHFAPELLKGAEAINDSITKHQAAEQQAQSQQALLYGDMAHGAITLNKTVGMPLMQAMDFVVQPGLATKRIKPEDYKQLRDQIAGLPPEQQVAALNTFRDAASKIDKGDTLSKDAVHVDRYGRTESSNVVEEKPTEASLALKAAGGDAQATAAMGILKPKPAGNPAERDDERYRNIQAQASMKQPVSPADQAWAAGYEKQKTLSVDKGAAAAGDRQAAAIAQQNALQGKAQAFNVAQAARKELTDKVEGPYLTAQASAATLRDTVDAAKAGNKVAGSLQSLETTMAAIRAQGLNRINTAEIGVTANAGGLYDRVAGWLGKAKEGQPVPPEIQKDMQEFAGILEKAAYKKYANQFDSVAKFYGLTEDQKKLKMAPPGIKALKIVNGQLVPE